VLLFVRSGRFWLPEKSDRFEGVGFSVEQLQANEAADSGDVRWVRVGIAADRATLLLTGATGFVGGELLRALRAREQVRCLVRDASKLQDPDGLDTVEADLGEPDSLVPALEGVREVYYLVHSMEPGVEGGFAERDRQAAQNFCEVAGTCGVQRTIYLGGVSGSGEQSEHLNSRNEVEEILRECSKEFVALRASMIVGAASASFGTLVQLVDRLPALLFPTWREHRVQPVAIDDVVAALVAARHVAPGSYEIGGPDVLTFEEMTGVVAELLGQRHRSLSLPFSSSKIEAAAASAVVDADRELLEPLLEGLHEDLLAEKNSLPDVFGVEPTTFADAARSALEAMDLAGSAPD
jgi:uncharacterized protein YbjT (DUF2867 family)